MPRALKPELKDKLLKLKKEDLTVPKISSMFGTTNKVELKDGKRSFNLIPPEYSTTDTVLLKANEYINKKEIKTTVGSILFNKLLIEGLIEEIIPDGFYNEVINKKGFGKLMGMISDGLMEDKLTIDRNLVPWLNAYELYGMKCCTIFSPSYSRGLLEPNKKVVKKKEELLKSKSINSVRDMSEIEDALVDYARNELNDDPAMTLFKSGARGSFDNDYKNMNLMLGPVAVPGKDGVFDMVKSSYVDGLKKEDMVAAGNVIINSAYPKAVDLILAA